MVEERNGALVTGLIGSSHNHAMNTLQVNSFDALTRVVEITNEIFGTCSAKVSYDPEYADEKWVVLVVEIDRNQNGVALESSWIERVMLHAPASSRFRLSIQHKK